MHRTRQVLERALQVMVSMTKHPLATLVAGQLGQMLRKLSDREVETLAAQLLDWAEELEEAYDADRAVASGNR